MTERELILLGFKSEQIKDEGDEESFYYVLDIVDGVTFISPMNEEVKDDNWYVEFFDTDPKIRFHNFGELQGLINQLNRAIVKSEK
jgi:hypothetical protein